MLSLCSSFPFVSCILFFVGWFFDLFVGSLLLLVIRGNSMVCSFFICGCPEWAPTVKFLILGDPEEQMKSFWSVLVPPESICSQQRPGNEETRKVLRNFCKLCQLCQAVHLGTFSLYDDVAV